MNEGKILQQTRGMRKVRHNHGERRDIAINDGGLKCNPFKHRYVNRGEPNV